VSRSSLSSNLKITVLVGGVGGAKFLVGLRELVPEPSQITAIVNVGDDIWLHGLRICPDLDTCMYTLGGGVDKARGWGQADETWTVGAELAKYKAIPDWFSLGDRDIATHLIRSQMLRAGYDLADITEALCARWRPGVRLLPVSNDRAETHVVVTDPETGNRQAIHFQEWWVRHRTNIPTHEFLNIGSDQAKPAPGVLAAIEQADVVLFAPSNPIVSIDPILSIPGVRGALQKTTAKVVGLSPIIGGKPLRGMADACLDVLGIETSAEAVGRHFGGRSEGGVLDGWLVHTGDTAEVPGVEVRAVPLLMTDPAATAEMAREAIALAGI
jgi:LPPG:FO 2-phospho-L-lactate transferase